MYIHYSRKRHSTAMIASKILVRITQYWRSKSMENFEQVMKYCYSPKRLSGNKRPCGAESQCCSNIAKPRGYFGSFALVQISNFAWHKLLNHTLGHGNGLCQDPTTIKRSVRIPQLLFHAVTRASCPPGTGSRVSRHTSCRKRHRNGAKLAPIGWYSCIQSLTT